ncbi:uncharacterized protein FFUJ_05404 [Fusarium fujikuroi IMI 58289]|uniref:Arrestin-like N-terminal domain-containing protein n=1 Tax=Gibberella fujikuroi (strain CBS 195.34 / IMI 58289 / NRRL A-6831) TaxID=1279085 RepID=S0E6Z9_GIBF5|nr:uncharacterized protein FFUJ_05404 [Fusarium fujikuroi IMI 58289]CCT69512.1 uncharacterized protein FFUJ_05404 [Fusarium fujikuroi IMI 58289]SCO26537.1 uncharacterized protein FFM5_14806 [Fusarium fujikuroi]
MRLELVLEANANAHSYRPGDCVRGELLVWGHRLKQPSEITAELQGKLSLHSNKRQIGATSSSTYTGSPCNKSDDVVHTLFQQTKKIKLATNNSTFNPQSYNHDADYYAPFDFTLPNSTCQCRCQLPPSLDRSSSGYTVKVEYAIIVTIKHRLLCRVSRLKTLRRAISFESEPSIPVLPSSNIGSLSASKLFPKLYKALASQGVSRIRSRSDECLPQYEPTLQLELLLPSPPILTPGRPSEIQLILHTPSELINSENIYIRSVEAQLETCIEAKVGLVRKTVTETQTGWSLQGMFCVDRQNFELDLGAWGQYLIIDALPTSKSCVLDTTHLLRISVGISVGGSERTQVVEASLEVIIIGAPPSYTAVYI